MAKKLSENKEKKRNDGRRRVLLRRRRTKKRILLVVESLLAVLLLVFITGFGYWNAMLSKVKHSEIKLGSVGVNAGVIDSKKTDGKAKPAGRTGKELIALVGLDSRGAEAEPEGDYENSDTMIVACIDHDNKQIKLASIYRDTYLNVFYNNGTGVAGYDDYYDKANNAYAQGQATQFLTMLNKNLDLNISEYITVNFVVLSEVIEDLGGLDIAMTREEAIHMNDYNQETSKVAGVEYKAVELPPQEEFDGDQLHTFHLSGTQAVSYARIRQTAGNDMRRTERQRDVLNLIMQKAKSAGVSTILKIANTVLPEVETSMDATQITALIPILLTYNMGDQTGFPFEDQYVFGEDAKAVLDGKDAILPVTLADNVTKLHTFFFPGEAYAPSAEVQAYSQYLVEKTGYTDMNAEPAAVAEAEAEAAQTDDADTQSADDASTGSDDQGTDEAWSDDQSADDGSADYESTDDGNADASQTDTADADQTDGTAE